ncbi:MAG: nitrogenase molybdenum-iron protein, alpha and beta chain [Treponema sp.]|jgi:nitrogenase molybdenum-iron protein beta chain|nr:nitrogenase molybdenum-iron protein, alpha and beta chain [Treponema sp.]
MSVILENPHGSCALGGANATLSAIRRVVPIFHSGPGCGMQTTAGEASQGSLRLPYFVAYTALPSTNMLEREVIFGGEKKLDEHIAGALDIFDADAFFVLSGCTAGIIGDDLQSVVQKYREKGAPVYAVNSAGFLGESYRGYEIALKALLDNIVDPQPEGREGDLVNVLGIMPYHDPYWEGNFEEILRLLNKLGLRGNTFFSHNQGIADIRRSSRAALNIILHPWLLKDAAAEYLSRFGIPSLRWSGTPLGATDTGAFLRAVGEAAGRSGEAEALIEEEERYLYRYMETGLGLQSWRRFAVVGESANVVPITRFLANDYGFTPEAAILTDVVFRPEDKKRIEDQLLHLESVRPPQVFYSGDQWEINQTLEKFPETTLLIGSTNEGEYAMKHQIQHFIACYPNTERLIYNRSCAGYRGALTFMEDIYSNL